MRVLLAASLLALALAGAGAPAGGPELLRVQVVRSFPHDPAAFTQGLVWHRGRLFESTGLYGRSSVREVERGTGRVLRRRNLAPRLFGEGLALVGDRLVVLTWKEGLAEVLDRDSLRLRDAHRYAGEGWGLCHDGRSLVQSDGSANLTFRDPATFAARRRLAVFLERPAFGLRAGPVTMLNELECVGGSVWANVWQTDAIVRIDARSGRVTAVVDASGLLTAREQAGADVLNGIAWDPARRSYLLTGKLWPRLFEARFVPAR